VTGGAGFIVSNVVAALNAAGRSDVAVCGLLRHAALKAADLVVIFEEDTPIELSTHLKSKVLVIGGDHTCQQLGHAFVEAHDGEVALVDVPQGHSTSPVKRAREGRI
jgi:bifunctional ADP-heptose synthase (sugar kinase/adenylyltransferase)